MKHYDAMRTCHIFNYVLQESLEHFALRQFSNKLKPSKSSME
jgi:hypothetical protein